MKKIHALFTGGTIAMRTNEHGLLVPAVSGEELTRSIPALRNIAQIDSSQFSNLPSAQMSPERVMHLRQRIMEIVADDDVAGVVVIHGTDTMEETAFLLDASLSDTQLNNKPVVLTGAMRSNDQLSADGVANLLAAVQVAVAESSRGRGVMIALNDEIHSARFVRKMDTSSVQAFGSPQFVALGRIAHAEPAVQYTLPAQRYLPVVDVSRETLELPRVDIVNMYAGADAALLNASIQAGAQAVVVQAVGASSVSLELYEGIASAIKLDVAIVIASRSTLGVCAPVYGYIGGGQTLAQLGASFSHDLPAHKARLFAQLLLSQAKEGGQFKHVQQGFALLKQYQ